MSLSDEGTPLTGLQKHGYSSESLWATSIAAASTLADGYAIACIGSAVVLIQSDLHLTDWQVAVFVGIMSIAIVPGAALGGWVADQVGRKNGLGLSYITLAAGAVIMAMARSYATLVIGRAIESVGIGSGLVIAATYLSEISPRLERGQRGGLFELYIIAGVTLNGVVAVALYGKEAEECWRWMLGVGALVPTLLIVVLASGVCPESPRYLLLAGKRAEAIELLRRLVGESEAELTMSKWEPSCTFVSNVSWMHVFYPKQQYRRRALILAVVVMVCQMMSGITFLQAVMPTLFDEEKSVSTNAAFIYSMVVCLVRFAVCFITLPYVDSFGRRPVLLLSYAGVIAGLLVLSISYYLHLSLAWKAAGLLMYFASFDSGLGQVPIVYMGEILDSEIRSRGVSLCVATSRLFSGIFTISLWNIARTYSLLPCFLVIASVNMLGILFLIRFMPETKCISLEAMHKVFSDTDGEHSPEYS